MSHANIPLVALLALGAACAPVGRDDGPADDDAMPNAVTESRALPSARARKLVFAASGYRAGGNEPFWQIRFSESAMEFEHIGGELAASAPRPDPQAVANGWRFAAGAGGRPFVVEIERRFCQDSMSARPFPHTVTATVHSQTFEGCGGDTASLLTGGEWRMAEIEGRSAAGRPTMLFGEDGSLTGNAGCNRYRATYEIAGDGRLAIGRALATSMACADPALTTQERRLLGLLERGDRFDLAEDGSLRLYARDAVVIAARR